MTRCDFLGSVQTTTGNQALSARRLWSYRLIGSWSGAKKKVSCASCVNKPMNRKIKRFLIFSSWWVVDKERLPSDWWPPNEKEGSLVTPERYEAPRSRQPKHTSPSTTVKDRSKFYSTSSCFLEPPECRATLPLTIELGTRSPLPLWKFRLELQDNNKATNLKYRQTKFL